MVKPSEENLDGLEIVSIGKLYSGPWEKKYWSSSRGKDRYPYPIGYQAARTNNGITYKMETREGLKGPLFVITSSNGESCSGQTPGIAWESFQKNGCCRINLLHGKRFSCKIDGVEIFGFRNPFVQRLLRELVANVDGTAEQSLLSSSICQGGSGTASCTGLDMPPHSVSPEIKRGRSRKHKLKNVQSVNGDSHKKLRPQDKHNAEASKSQQETPQNLKERNSKTKKGRSLESSEHLNKDVLFLKGNKKIKPEKCIAIGVAGNLSIDDEPLDRSEDTEGKQLSSSMIKENRGEASIPHDFQNVNDSDLYAPDTLDPLHDYSFDSVPKSHKESPSNVQGELISGHFVKSEGIVIGSNAEELGISSGSSEKSDFDSVNEEIAKSMMTLLLPRALPLLKTFSRKKMQKIKSSEVEINGSNHYKNTASPASILVETSFSQTQEKEKMHLLSSEIGPVFSDSGQVMHFVPDSFENDQCENHDIGQLPPFSSDAEAIQAPVGPDSFKPEALGLPVSVEAPELSIYHCETNGGKIFYPHDEVDITSTERPQNGCDLVSNSDLGCTSSTKKVCFENYKGICLNSDGKSVCLQTPSMKKDLKISPNGTEGTSDDKLKGDTSSVQMSCKEISAGEMGFDTTTSFTQTAEVASPIRYNCPLTESIICRNNGDDCATKTNDSIVSENRSVRSIDHGLRIGDLSSAEAKFEGYPQSLHTEKTPINPDGVLHCMPPVVLHEQSAHVSMDKDNPNFFNQSVACIEKPQDSFNEDMLSKPNLIELNDSVSWMQKKKTRLCDGSSLESKDSSNFEPDLNMGINNKAESIAQLVGCYVHPMPVSSVLVSVKENCLYLCVLCSSSNDTDRTLFMYKIPVNKVNVRCPFFIGHTQIKLPTAINAFRREIDFDRSGLQFTPDGKCLVLLNDIKAPNCRNGKMHCPCSECTSNCLEKNAVKIVQVKAGYVTEMVRLKSADNLLSILVCEPNYLIGVEEKGKLHLWVMNSTWSGHIEEGDLPTSDCISPGIMELKRIPRTAALIVGHNGFGEFSLWDISRRILVSRFSSPSTSVFQFLPISVVRLQRGPTSTDPEGKKKIAEVMAATKMSFSNHVDISIQGEEEDVAIWLLISTLSDSDIQHDHQFGNSKMNSVGSWKLALLVNNIIILGTALDSRVAATGACGGHGIIGTCDGVVYMWELSTGNKLGNLHFFKGGTGVSCVATDNSRSGIFAVAGGNKLLVYSQEEEPFSNL